ncbi:hypothetical protein HG530_003313 [Fusarium avenaceum]|nr:hypothetical protein HG530_003313 [Fusarium avenaceum]
MHLFGIVGVGADLSRGCGEESVHNLAVSARQTELASHAAHLVRVEVTVLIAAHELPVELANVVLGIDNIVAWRGQHNVEYGVATTSCFLGCERASSDRSVLIVLNGVYDVVAVLILTADKGCALCGCDDEITRDNALAVEFPATTDSVVPDIGLVGVQVHGAEATSNVNEGADEVSSRLGALSVEMSEDAVLSSESTGHDFDGAFHILFCEEEHAGLVS